MKVVILPSAVRTARLYPPENISGRLRLKCDGTRAEARFRLSAKRTSPFKSSGASVQSTTGSRGVRISGSNVGYIMFRGSVKSTGYPLHSPVSPSLPLSCVTVYHHISTGVYKVARQHTHTVLCYVMLCYVMLSLIRPLDWAFHDFYAINGREIVFASFVIHCVHFSISACGGPVNPLKI